ncbi:hypothetical protein [Gordonia sp. FQ]|uniref:hypothetical protein n=1 Tax=Gordonia sp. FQ TaxID=3446634 RepID=UPI003F835773
MLRKVSWVSTARFKPFLAACDDDEDLAWSLYEWNAHVASALVECFHHTEVLLRNAMMTQLEKTHPLSYPWQQELPTVVEAAKKRRQSETKIASPDSIISELTLGFWLNLLDKGAENDELWRTCLHNAFPKSPGTRPAVHKAVADMHRLRNRCAHQDSLLDFDPAIELKKLLSLVEWIDPAARTWLESIESVSKIAATRPVSPRDDVVIVGASADMAVAMYEHVAAYVCPAGRSFAPVEYMGFYHDKKIDPFFPKILDIVVPTRWTPDEQQALKKSSDSVDKHVARAMGYGLANGWDAGDQHQVFLLSTKDSPDTLKRSAPILHRKTGRGSAFVQNKRYLPKSALLAANDTDHLTGP